MFPSPEVKRISCMPAETAVAGVGGLCILIQALGTHLVCTEQVGMRLGLSLCQIRGGAVLAVLNWWPFNVFSVMSFEIRNYFDPYSFLKLYNIQHYTLALESWIRSHPANVKEFSHQTKTFVVQVFSLSPFTAPQSLPEIAFHYISIQWLQPDESTVQKNIVLYPFLYVELALVDREYFFQIQ